MSKLKNLQKSLQNYILDKENTLPSLQSPKNMTVQSRMDVYKDAYYARLESVLAKDYEMLKKAVGDQAFLSLVKSYLHCNPSKHYSALYVGEHLSAYLQSTACPQFYVELAKFEWSFRLAHSAKDQTVLTVADLKKLSSDEQYESLHLGLHCSCQLLAFSINTIECYEALKENNTVDIIEVGEHNIIVWRRGLNAYYMTIDPLQKKLIELIKQPISLLDISVDLQDSRFAKIFHHMIECGLIGKFG